MWENCVRVNPDDAFIHDALCAAWQRGVIGIESKNTLNDHSNWIWLRATTLRFAKRAMGLASAPNLPLEDRQQAVELAERACNLTQRQDAQCLAALPVTYCSLANAQVTEGQFAAALDNYRKALQADPAYSAAKFNMSFLLATCRDQSLAIRSRQSVWPKRAARPLGNRPRISCGFWPRRMPRQADSTQLLPPQNCAGEIARQTGNTALLQGIQRWIEDCRQQAP